MPGGDRRLDRNADKEPGWQRPHRQPSVRATATTVVHRVIDNGAGLPKQNRDRLLEPYVTTRAQGHRARPRHRAEDRWSSTAAR